MKKILPFIFLLCLSKTYAQHLIGHDNSTRPIQTNDNKLRITDSTQVIEADMLPYKSDPKIKNDRYYFWVADNTIHSTQGGFNGQLLNGHYVAFYPDKNLKEEGGFDRGLKQGTWKTWNRKGDLTAVTNWNEGIVEPEDQKPFWKKMPFGKKNDDQPAPANTTPPPANQ
jgi:hypothetical protein